MKLNILMGVMMVLLLKVTLSTTINVPKGVSLSNYNTLTSDVVYTFNMTFLPLDIPSESTLLMQFSIHYSIDNTNLKNCQYSLTGGAYSAATCTVAFNNQTNLYEVIFSNIYITSMTNQGNLDLQFSINNPQMAATENIYTYLMGGGSFIIGSGLISISYNPSPLTGCSYVSSSDTTGVSSTRTISFTPTVPVYAGSTFVMTLPPWFGINSNHPVETNGGTFTCVGVLNSDNPSPDCISTIYQDSVSLIYYQQFDVLGLINNYKASPGTITFTAGLIRNPPSLAPFGPITFQVKIADPNAGNALVTSQICTDIYQTVTKMNTPASVSLFINGTLNISTSYTNRNPRLGIRSPFSAVDGRYMISFPSSVQMSFNLTSASSNPPVLVSATSTSMTFSSVVAGDLVGSGTLSIFGVNILTPPSSRPFIITLTSQVLQNGTIYGIDSGSITYVCQTGPLRSVSVVLTVTNVNAVTQYLLTFTTSNELISGSFISVHFPGELTATAGSCSTNHSAISCSVTNTSYALLSISGAVSSNSIIRVTFPSVKNPIQAHTTSSFRIITYYDSGFDSVVDTATTGITMTSTSNLISVSVTPTSYVTFALTRYTFTAPLADMIPANGYIKITFPPTVTFDNVVIASSTFSSASCALSMNSSILTISACFAADMTNLNLSIAFNGIYNPPSLQPTTTFAFQTYGPLGQVNYVSSGIIITMTTPATTTAFSIAPLSTTVHQLQQYNVAFTFAVPHQSGDYFTLTVPSSMPISSPPSCSVLSGNISTNCVLQDTTTVRVSLIGVPSASAQIRISTIRNYDVGTTLSFQVFFFSSSGYAMQTTALSTVTYTPTSITIFSISSNDQIALYENSNLTITLSTPFIMDSSFASNLTSLSITPPSQFTVQASTTCSPLLGACTINNSTFTISPVGLSLSSFTITISNIKLPFFNSTSNSFAISYLYNGSSVAVVNSGVVVTVFCTSPCQRCVSTKVACASCLPTPNTAVFLHTVNSSCLTSCPDGFFAGSNKVCQACNSPCFWCSDSVNCTKCSLTTYLFNNTCLASCPATYYGNSSNICASCNSPCFNCTSSTACLSCAINFYTNFSCVSAESCPSGTYGDTSTLTCAPCTSPCSNCFNTTSNCTSCVLGFVYYQNACPLTCPFTYYNSSSVCTACSNPCGNCTSSTNCLSCLTDFLLNSSCVSASSCPTGTYADSSTKTCTTCPTGCTSCQTPSNCSACKSSFFFNNYQCVNSCPNTTFTSGSTCVACSVNCLTCSLSSTSCTSCASPLLLSSSNCLASCPNGTYSNGVNCQTCASTCLTCTDVNTCTTCTGSLYLSNNRCVSTCPSGTFKDTSTNNCSTCDPTCLTCSGTSTTCTGCSSPAVYYSGSCQASCPTNYFNISGVCQTCSNCGSCISISACSVCNAGFYMLSGVCYGVCPPSTIGDALSMTCTQCNSTCATCSGNANYCLSCGGNLFLMNGACVSNCPTGYIVSSGQCTLAKIGSIVYFPFSIAFTVFLIIVLYSKSNHVKTQSITILCGFLGFLVLISWIVIVSQAANNDQLLQPSNRELIIGIGLLGILTSVLLGTIFAIWFRNYFKADDGFNTWVCHKQSNLNAYKIVFFMTLFSFPSFRLAYGRFFNRAYFSCFLVKGGDLLSASAKFAFIYVLLCIFPLIYVSAYVIYIKQQYDQTLIYSIDALLLNIILLILLIIDTNSKDETFFNQMIQDQPYLKRFKYNQLDHSLSSIRDFQDNKARPRSEPNERQKDQLFRNKVTIFDNLNKFGHLNEQIEQMPGRQRKVKTLPNQNDLIKLPQFDINQDQINVIDDQFFFLQQERRRKRQQQQQKRLKELQEEQQRKRKLREEEQERQRRRKRLQDDMDQQHSVQFPDLAAIEKAEKKGENMKRSPTQLLNGFKKIEDRQISEKDKKKIQEIAKKNGLDPEFMAATFGIQKNHNPELLNSIIDKHNHVDRQAVKQLFSPQSNPEILQQMFSKKSNLNPDRLRALLNDPDSAQIIKNLVNSEQGIVSPEIVKLLLQNKSKFSDQFVKQLMFGGLSKQGSNEGMDPQKIKQLLKDNPDKASREAALKALKKIGGDNLQNKQLLENLLGKQSLLETQNFTRVVNDLPKKVLENLFGTKSKTNDIIIQKLLNNKKIDLKNLSPILEDPQLLQELALALGSGNEALVQNLLNLFKNGEPLDPHLLKQFLKNPILVQKLGSSTAIDPSFLSNLLKKQAKTDLSLLQKAISKMSPQQIQQVFEYNPQKNIDFQKISKLFEYNSKTDPNLIADLLTAQIVANIYNKSSSAKTQILNKLVQKGKHVDPDQIIKIYGDDSKPNGFRDTAKIGNDMENKKYNITDNNFNLQKEDFDSQLGGYKKGMNQINMSRTDGRMLGFLSPIQVGVQKNKKYRNKHGMNEIDDLQDEQITEYEYGQGGEKIEDNDDEYEIIEGKRRRKKKPKKKPLDDIRLPSEHIYLQRLEAPHEMKKKNIRKKKKVVTSMQKLQPMDQENEVYDLDF